MSSSTRAPTRRRLTGFAIATVLGTALTPLLLRSGQAEAYPYQFGISNHGPYCECDCFTGYCCDIPDVCD